MLKSQTKRTALVEVNRIRGSYGVDPIVKLPHGYRHDLYACPVARALVDCLPPARHMVHPLGGTMLRQPDAHVTVTPFAIWIAGERVDVTPVMKRFVRKFDRGEYPELVA